MTSSAAPKTSDLIVVGAGILGLAVARELLHRHPGARVLILEKEDRIAAHQTGHNSGVIHSGIYYAPGSLKARLCVEGSRDLYAYCAEWNVPVERCGKVVVATDESELPRLEELHRRGAANGVSGLEVVGPEALTDLEPNVRGLRALSSPTTGIVDFKRVARVMADEVVQLGGTIRTETTVLGILARPTAVTIETSAGAFEGGGLITCAGLYSDRLAAMTGGSESPKITPFRGRYYALRPQSRVLVRGLVYPVPDPAFPFLGVHFTKQISGEVWAGPNAVLAFAREGYRARDVRLRELWETISYPGFHALTRRYWRVGLAELHGDLSKRTFAAALRRLVPSLRHADLSDAHTGVRAQALNSRGELLDDFWIDEAENVVHVRNAPSPAATSSLSLARMIADMAERRLSIS